MIDPDIEVETDEVVKFVRSVTVGEEIYTDGDRTWVFENGRDTNGNYADAEAFKDALQAVKAGANSVELDNLTIERRGVDNSGKTRIAVDYSNGKRMTTVEYLEAMYDAL